MGERLTFEDQIVVVTGAGQGVGRAYALELARRGAKVVVNDLGANPNGAGADSGPAARVVAEIVAAGGAAVANGDSVATAAGGQAIVDTALNAWGRIDALIHNAGILRDASFAKLNTADLQAVMDVHLWGAIYTGQPAFRAMRDAGRGGRILFTTSSSGLFGNFGQSSYAIAKMGVVGLVPAEPLTAPSVGYSEIFQSGGGWVARVALQIASGYLAEGPDAAEDLFLNWNTVRDGGWSEPKTALDLGALLQTKLGLEALTY